MSHSFPCYHQLDAMDCGPTCLRMVAQNGWQKYEKLLHSQAVTKALGKMPAPLRERENDCLILK